MNYKASRVLVTGADGFIGSHLAERLSTLGAEVTALSLYNSFDAHGWLDELDAADHPRLTRVRGDVRDAAFIQRIVAEQDVVFHLAALIAIPYSYAAPQSYVETNVLGTLNILEAARACGVRRVVHTSTSEVYGTAQSLPITEAHPLQGQSPYSASKIGADMMAEAFARSYGLPVAIIRPFNTFGPRQSERAVIPTVIRQMLDPGVQSIRVGDVTTVRDFTFVADTVAAFLAVGFGDAIEFGCPYNAGSGRAVTIADMIEVAGELVGSRKAIIAEDARKRPHKSEVLALQADSSRLNADAGWTAAVDLREGLRRTVQWWRSRIAGGQVRREFGYMT